MTGSRTRSLPLLALLLAVGVLRLRAGSGEPELASHLDTDVYEPGPCGGLQGESLISCCAKAAFDIVRHTETAILWIAAKQTEPGDAEFARMTADCMRRKRHLASNTDCAAVKFQYRRHKYQDYYCTNAPFTDDKYLLETGMLPGPSSTSQLEDCRQQRFLLWTRNMVDYDAGHSHTSFAYHCAFWEAYSLNRTLVLDSFAGMGRIHSGGDYNAEVPYTAWYGTGGLTKLPEGGMLYHEFVKGCGAPGLMQEANGDLAIMPSGSTHRQMAARSHVPLLVREWDVAVALKPAHRFGFQVCHPKKPKVEKNTFHEPADLNFTMPREYRGKPYADWVYQTAGAIQGGMWQVTPEGNYAVCLHVRRGDKVRLESQIKKYPTLDYDTSPEGIHKTIEPYVPHGSTLYIATNERDPVTFFKPLEQYYTVLSLAHFPEFLHFENFLPSTLALVDYAVLVSTACDMSIPTFASELSRGFPEYISLSQLLK
eukprot:TRINITY_DN5892_c0_g1_i1.p1 TRINITY_DN5892_c0_g1~~TRINITY_DN5892_c0_g1_i1.p1  ORF type:complete len:482 (-),score=52.07 TRINITY_DN5892_c0_g1_i1:244-1689(-)